MHIVSTWQLFRCWKKYITAIKMVQSRSRSIGQKQVQHTGKCGVQHQLCTCKLGNLGSFPHTVSDHLCARLPPVPPCWSAAVCFVDAETAAAEWWAEEFLIGRSLLGFAAPDQPKEPSAGLPLPERAVHLPFRPAAAVTSAIRHKLAVVRWFALTVNYAFFPL